MTQHAVETKLVGHIGGDVLEIDGHERKEPVGASIESFDIGDAAAKFLPEVHGPGGLLQAGMQEKLLLLIRPAGLAKDRAGRRGKLIARGIYRHKIAE